MSDEHKQFLVTYNRTTDQAEVADFGTDVTAALDAYEAAEDACRDRPEIEVVLLGSDSIDTIRHTHANYFTEGRPLSEMLAPH